MFDPRPLCCSSLTTAVGGTKDTNIVDSESPYCEHYFVIILYVLSFFLSFIAKGLAMCRLGGVISAPIVLF